MGIVIALKALIQEPSIGPKHPAVQRGLEFVRRFQRDDGGVYSAEGLLKSYETSVALSMFAVLKDPIGDDRETILEAAANCPVDAIKVEDTETGEVLHPEV